MGSHSYLQNLCSGSDCDQMRHLQQLYKVPHLQNLYAGATHLTPEQEAAMHQNDDHMHGADSYLQQMYKVPHLQEMYKVPHLQEMYKVPHLQEMYKVPHLQEMYKVPHLQQMYCGLTHLADCFWVNIKW